MTDEPTPNQRPEPGESATEADAEGPDEGAVEGETASRKPFLLHFPRSPIPGTELSVRSPSIGQDREMWKDATDEALDDREFTVRLVHRQLDQQLPIEDVRAWPDEQLLAASDAFVSLDTTEPDEVEDEEPVEGEAEVADGDDEAADGDAQGEREATAHGDGQADDHDGDLEPLTFPLFRDEIKAMGVRRAKRMKGLAEGILALSRNNTSKLAELMEANPAFDAKLGLGIGRELDKIKGLMATDAFKGFDTSRLSGITGVNAALKGLDMGKLGGLGDTSKIGAGLSKMLANHAAMEKFARPPIELPVPRTEPLVRVPYIGPIVRPEVRLLEDVGETLERMHDDQTHTSTDQLGVMVQQTALLKIQGEALTALVKDARGQKWSRRGVLATAIVAAVASVLGLAYNAGILRPYGAATPAGPATPAPIVNPTPATSPNLAPTPTVAPTPATTPITTPAKSAAPPLSP